MTNIRPNTQLILYNCITNRITWCDADIFKTTFEGENHPEFNQGALTPVM